MVTCAGARIPARAAGSDGRSPPLPSRAFSDGEKVCRRTGGDTQVHGVRAKEGEPRKRSRHLHKNLIHVILCRNGAKRFFFSFE